MAAFDIHENLRNRNETYDLLFKNQSSGLKRCYENT